MGYLFQYLNELIIKNLDVKLFNLLLIMIFTFYYQDSSSDIYKKYYLFKYVENNDNYKKRKLWEDYLKGLILSDIKQSQDNNINLNYIHFLNIMSVIKSMTDLHLGKDFINDFIEYTNITYKLKEDQVIQINYILNDSEYGSFNENERSTVSTEINEILNQSFANSLDTNDNRFSNNSNIIINKNNDQENNSNINILTDNKNESDGSVESIDVEVMPKNK